MKNNVFKIFNLERDKKSLHFNHVNPTDNTLREDAETSIITAFEYDATSINQFNLKEIKECERFVHSTKNVWINVEGLRRDDVMNLCGLYKIDPLTEEDILSLGQRSKSDSYEEYLYCLMYMLTYIDENKLLNKEQISLILGKNFILTFQDDNKKDAFDKVRQRLQNKATKMQQYGIDFLYYSLIDAIVDEYFITMELFAEKLEHTEDKVVRDSKNFSMEDILFLRKELLVFRRTMYAARDVVSNLNKNENGMFEKHTERYLKDLYDHIFQAAEIVENYREGMANLQDLYMNIENLKMNESMKVMAIVTCLLAPATVIGGTFGMNFEHIPFLHDKYAFYIAVFAMLIIPVWMIYVFKKRGWF